MQPFSYFIALICILYTLTIAGKALSIPIAVIDPSYTTGTAVLTTTTWANTSATNFLVNYQTIMSTSSLNATLGIMGINYYIIGTQWGFRMSIVSITASSLNILLNVKNSNNPIYYLRICYFVTYNNLLDVNWVSYSFGSTDPIANYTLTPGTCFFSCRVYTTTQAFKPKTGGTIISTLSGFEVNNNPQPPNSTTYFGITLEPRQPSNSTTASSFMMNVTVYGGAEVTFVSYFYISFEANTINVINYRQATFGYSKAIGCYFTNYCSPQTISKIGHTSVSTQVFSYNQNNFFIGFSRMIMTWAGDNSTTAEFNITSIYQNSINLTIGIPFSFTGNPNKDFQVALSYFTMQTFYCSTVGSDIYYVYNSNYCDSNCNGGIQQYANATNFCLPCGTYCWTCFGSANNCTGCYNNQSRVLSGNACVCDTAGGFYDDGSSVVCPVCHYSCNTCNGGGASFCLTCDNATFRSISSNSCPCITGYYDAGGVVCLACHYTCQTATCNINTNVGCQSCNLTKNRVLLLNFSCGCANGYYDNSTNTEQCATCHYSCLTCWGTNKFCTLCSSTNNRYFNTTDNTCRCNTGFFDNGVSLCSACHPTCYTCSGALAFNCLSCNPAQLRSLVGNTCPCNVRYYDSSNTCLSCSYTCYTCLSSANNNCTTCNSAAYRTINSTSSSCPCQAGYFDNGIQLCSLCSPSCLTCISSASNCSSCHSNPGRYYSGSSYSCLCSSGYVDTTFNGYCTACSYICSTCSTSPTNCNSCSSNRIWNGGLCTCPDGTYDNGISATCLSCASTCATCNSGLSTSCTSCNSTLLRSLSISPTGACICSASYYDAGLLMCQPCSSSCSACWGSATNCTVCDSATNHRIISSANTCVCVAGYVDVGGAACLACLSSCLTCALQPNNCTSCNADRILASGVCSCKNGAFQDASMLCQACSYSCATCATTSLTCLTCPNGSNRVLLSNSCPCAAGYMETGTSFCAPCSYTCGSCSLFANVCSSCPSNSFRTLTAASACPCNDGYYDGSSSICLPCSKTCLTCTYYSMCVTCNSTQNRVLDSINQVCICVSGYYDSGNAVCSTCHYSCASCSGSGSSKCTTCQTGRTLSSSSCPCSNGTYDSLGTCSSCSLTCNTCEVTATNCTSCAAGSYLSNGKCICNVGYYFNGNICTQCDAYCYSCSVTSTNCTACNSAQGKVLNGSTCQCPSNKYYNTSMLSCLSCDVSCSTCVGGSKNSCLTCNSLAFRNFNSGLSCCDCLSTYYDNGSAYCQKCTSPCLTCNGGSTLNCTSCISGFTLIGSSCTNTAIICPNFVYQGIYVNICPNTTFAAGPTCLPCINHCLTCATSSYCYSCVASYFLFNNTCLLSCPTNSYLNSSNSRVCNSCPPSCLQCTTYMNQLTCLSCVSGYYLLDYSCTLGCPTNGTHVTVGQNCYPCLYPCSTCTAISTNGCTGCNQGYSLFNGMCLDVCPQGYLSKNCVCISCPQNCSICRDNECLSCSSGFYLTLDGQCSAMGYYFSNGVQMRCHPNCLSCTDSSFSSCISCVQYRGDSSEMAISGYCDCWKNSIDLGDGTCDIVSYKHLQQFNDFLVTSTTSINYLSVLSGVISMNFLASAMNIFYQQTYSNFYFINSSAVLQTDAVLGRYGDTSITKFTKSFGISSAPRQQYGRRLADYSQSHLQDDQSLFMRGSVFEYSIDWLKIVVVLTGCLWALIVVLKCIKAGLKSKTTNMYILVNNVFHFLNQSAIIILLFFTINEVALYSIASIKIVFKKYSNSIDYGKLIPSILFFAYNVLYLLKLFCVSLKKQPSRQDQKKHKIIYAFFEGSKLNLRRCRIYVPLLLLRSLLLSICIVSFSYSPQTQTISSLIVIVLWDIYSFFCCPYAFYVQVFIRVHQILFTVQILLLTISVSNPEGSRLGVAKCMLTFNFLQILVFICLSISLLFDKLHNIKCLRREQNAVASSTKGLQETKAQIKDNSMIENTIESLNEKPNIQQINKPVVSSINSVVLKDYSEGKQQTSILQEEITRKRYRVKREKGQ